MHWRLHLNLIEGELDNHTRGKVTGWIRFNRNGKRPLGVILNLNGDFHEDIRGKAIRLTNPKPSERIAERERGTTYMEGFTSIQTGEVGDMTAGLTAGFWTQDRVRHLVNKRKQVLDEFYVKQEDRSKYLREFAEPYRKLVERKAPFYPYVDHPFIEWFSYSNGRVVLELESSQVEVIERKVRWFDWRRSKDVVRREWKRLRAMDSFLSGVAHELSQERRRGDEGRNVFGKVIK